jgi:hypothetical protein
MSIWSIPSPGKENGPCVANCKHKDCEESRRMAATSCVICGNQIGYETDFYLMRPDNDSDHAKEQHTRCA